MMKLLLYAFSCTILIFLDCVPRVNAIVKYADCYPSLMDFVAETPELSIWVPQGGIRPEQKLTTKECPGDVPNGYTLFIGDNKAVSDTAQALSAAEDSASWFGILTGDATVTFTTPNGTQCRPLDVATPAANAQAGYNQIPHGAFTADQLLAMGNVKTVLSYVTGNDTYNLDFYQDPETGNVCIKSLVPALTPCIVKSYFACDAVLHLTDMILIPNTDPNDYPETLETMYDIDVEDLKADNPTAQQCNSTLLQTLSSMEDVSLVSGALALTPQLLQIFDRSNTSITLFVSNDETYAKRFDTTTPAGERDVWNRIKDTLLQQILTRPYCSRELLQQGKINSLYGEVSETEMALKFEPGSDGQVLINGVGELNFSVLSDGKITVGGRETLTNNTATIVRTEEVCGSIIYVVDGFVSPPSLIDPEDEQEDAVFQQLATSVVLARPRPPIYPLGCVNEVPSAGLSGDTVESGSASAAESDDDARSLGAGGIAGIVAGAVAACCIAGFAVLALVKRKRRQQQQLAVVPDSKASGNGELLYASERGEAGRPNSEPSTNSLSRSTGSEGTAGALGSGPVSWSIDPSALSFDQDAGGERVVLGRGGFGDVYRGVLNGVQPVAIKVLRDADASCRRAFLREISVMQHVSRDKNVVQFYGTSTSADDSELMIISEVMEGGDLRRALSGPRSEELIWSRRGKGIAQDIARALCFLHANSILHRDVKSANVLLADDWSCAKLGDVGTAAVADGITITGDRIVGTLAWAAPEMLMNNKITAASDIYSFGIVLWEICTGCVPRRGFTQLPEVDEQRCPQGLIDLINDCIEVEPSLRPTAKQVYDRILQIPPIP